MHAPQWGNERVILKTGELAIALVEGLPEKPKREFPLSAGRCDGAGLNDHHSAAKFLDDAVMRDGPPIMLLLQPSHSVGHGERLGVDVDISFAVG